MPKREEEKELSGLSTPTEWRQKSFSSSAAYVVFFFLSFKTKLIRKRQRQWKLVFGLSAVVLGVVFPSKTQNPPLKRKITRVYTINFCFQASNTAQATFCTAVCPLRLGYVYRFIYYVPCDPLVPYPFFFSFPDCPVCLLGLYKPFSSSRDYNLFISCSILFCCSLYVRLWWGVARSITFFFLLLLFRSFCLPYLTFFLDSHKPM